MSVAPIPAFIHWVSRRALRWFYRDLRYIGAEQIPRSGPVLLIGNHPNDLTDVLAGFFTTPRPVRYVATISATMMPFASRTYRAMGVIPIMRIRDVRKMRARGMDANAVNASAFDAVQAAFAHQDVVAVFPEGGVHDTSYLGTFRQGVSLMALKCLDDDSTEELVIVPFGLQYEAPQTARSDMAVVIGTPLPLREWSEAEVRAGRAPAAAALSRALRDALSEVTRNSATWADAACRDRLVASVSAATAGATPLLDFSASIQHRCAALVASPADAATVCWRTIADGLSMAVRRAGGIETSALDTARVLAAAQLPGGLKRDLPRSTSARTPAVHSAEPRWPALGVLAIASVPALLGLLVHAPIWALVRWNARRSMDVRTDYAARAILPGLHLIFLSYLTLGGLFALGFRAIGWSSGWTVPALMLLPRLGDLGLWWRDGVRSLLLRARVARWSAADRAAVSAAAEELRAAWSALSTSAPANSIS